MPGYTPDALSAAITYLKNHPEISKLKIAKKYDVNVITLKRRVKGTQKSTVEGHRSQ